MLRSSALAIVVLVGSAPIHANEPAAPSADYGKIVSIIGACHDCHTADYAGNGGMVNPDTALKGNPVGYQGPWGTTYAINLRVLAASVSEDDWVKLLRVSSARPPMPFYNMQALDDIQLRSLHRYIVSLGARGDPAPAFVPPGQKPTFPYNVLAPPVSP
jgi:mono/diheme cytochrome c family protein